MAGNEDGSSDTSNEAAKAPRKLKRDWGLTVTGGPLRGEDLRNIYGLISRVADETTVTLDQRGGVCYP